MDEFLEEVNAKKIRVAPTPQSFYQISTTKRSISRWHANVNAGKDHTWWNYQDFRPKYRNLDEYSTIERLGQGKFSEVFEGVNDVTGMRCTIKLLKPQKKDRIRREVLVLQHMKNAPFSTNLLDLIRCPETRTVGLVYAYNDNVPIQKLFDQLTGNDIKRFIYQILLSVEYAHHHGIMHRDIKPGNILFDPVQKRAVLSDWGLAEFYHPHVEYHTKVGTKGYKSPELLCNLQEYDYANDMWAVGVTFGNMLFKGKVIAQSRDDDEGLANIAKLTGSDPIYDFIDKYKPTTASARFKAIGRYKPGQLVSLVTEHNIANIDDQALDLLGKMLVVDPFDRIPAHLALKHPYFDAIRDDIVS